MFDVGWDEMALVAVVALLIIGPKDLPHVLRAAGHWVRKARSLAGEFQRGVDEMVREADLHELKSQVEKAADPNALKREIETAIDPKGEIAKSLEAPRFEDSDMGSWNTPAPVPDAKTEPEPAPAAQPSRPPEP